jgi:hypothetical protein
MAEEGKVEILSGVSLPVVTRLVCLPCFGLRPAVPGNRRGPAASLALIGFAGNVAGWAAAAGWRLGLWADVGGGILLGIVRGIVRAMVGASILARSRLSFVAEVLAGLVAAVVLGELPGLGVLLILVATVYLFAAAGGGRG